MANLINVESLRMEYPDKVVLDGVSLGINEGDRIGVVGRNGDGKSTLLRILSGTDEPDSGRVTHRRNVTVGVLDQRDLLDPDDTVGRSIVGDQADHEWARDARIRGVVSGLVSDLDWNARVGTLSGGQRRRISLAALLVGDWDALFLDEPTNHLDLEAVTWLADHIKARWSTGNGALVVVTHDRWFLDEVSTTTWEVHDGIVEPFDGGYAAYVLQRVERDRQSATAEVKRQNLMRKELAWLRRGPPARTSKPKFRIDAANQLIESEPPVRDTVALTQLAVSRLGREVIDLEGAGVAYDGRTVLRDVTWGLRAGDRVGILGANGAGKTTLLRLVDGTTAPTTGRVKRGKTVKVEALTQQSTELELHARKRVRELLDEKRASFSVAGKEISAAQLLERLGFSSSQLSALIGDLSGGQRRRLQLLLILLDEPNVLILDEPTNDLDTDMLTALEDLLDGWPGCLLVVSHDRYFMERVTDLQYAVVGGRLQHLPGGVDQYLGLTADRVQSDSGGRPAGTARSGSEQHALRKELASIDRKLMKLPEQIAQADAKISAYDQQDYVGLAELAAAAQALRQRGDDLEQRWLELSEAIED